MKLGFIGLGRMGKAMVLRLLEQGVVVVVFNRSGDKTKELQQEYMRGITYQVSRIKYEKDKNKNIPNTKYIIRNTKLLEASYTVAELVSKLEKPRIIWLMVPEGKPVDEVIEQLQSAGLEKDDIIIDGGNSFFKDSIRRYQKMKKLGINFLDVGTSGGVDGARHGACIMVGGDRAIYNRVEPYFRAAATSGGYAYFGPAGAGHFVKMVHNGIEYGMLQAIGEGFEMLEKGPYKLDLHKVAFNYTKGSVVRGWLMELLENALSTHKAGPWLQEIEGVVGGGKTGQWTLATAKELKVETPVIEKSLEARKKSFAKQSFSGKVIAALRREFGGHDVQRTKNK